MNDFARLQVRIEANADRFNSAMKRTRSEFDRNARSIESRASQLDGRLSSAGGRFGSGLAAGLARVGGPIALAAAFGKLAQSTASAGEQVRVMQGRFEALTGSAERAEGLVRGVFGAASGTGTSLAATNDLVAQMRLATAEFGAADSEVVQFSENLLKLGAIGGSSANEVANGLRQLSQGLAGGVLRAEEFNSVIENTPLVAKALADELSGGSLGALRAMVLEGKVLSEDVFRAILSQSGEIGAKFETIPTTMGRAFENAQTAVTGLLAGLDDALGVSEAIVASISRFADAAGKIGALLSPEGRALSRQEDLAENFREVNRQLRLTEGDPAAAALREQLIARRDVLAAELKAGIKELNKLSGVSSAPIALEPIEVTGPAQRSQGGQARQTNDDFGKLTDRLIDANLRREEELRLIGLGEAARARESAAIARARLENELYAAAQKDGKPITDDLRETVSAYGQATESLTLKIHAAEAAERAKADASAAAARAAEDAKRNVEAVGNALTQGVLQANSFSEALKNVAVQLANFAIQGAFGAGPFGSIFQSAFAPPANFGVGGPIASAKGNVFAGGNVVPFAKGGIVSRPTVFPMPHGMGLMGEAGPEAILPLQRGPGGRLGVESTPAAPPVVNVVINSDRQFAVTQQASPDGRTMEIMIDQVTARNAMDPASATGRALDRRGALARR